MLADRRCAIPAPAPCLRAACELALPADTGVPLLTLFGANALRIYPMGLRRLTLFLAPCSILLSTAVLQVLVERIPHRLGPSFAVKRGFYDNVVWRNLVESSVLLD